MKRFLAIALAASMGLVFAGAASAVTVSDYPAGAAANGIGNSRHNLGSFGEHIVTSGTSEICVFCHTPHHTNTAVSPAPLWNRVNEAASYVAYGTTIGGTNVSSIGSVSLACLSCHDGVTTFDNLVNYPGKGGVAAGGNAAKSWSFLDAGTPVTDQITSARLKIGTDLSNDHPMSITYNSDRASLRPTGTTIDTIDLLAELNAAAPTAFGNNLSQNRWAIKGYISDTATIADLLRNGKVECSSCHDPHFNNKSWDEVDSTYNSDSVAAEFESNGLFLRRVGGNTGSGVCRTCHNK